MKKLWVKIVWVFALAILGFGSIVTLAQTSVPATEWFGNVGNASGIWVSWAGTDQWGKLIDVIKSFINWMLGMLALIALVVLIWGGFQMVTAAGDETKYKKGFKILQQAAIGLVFIWVSWLVVSVIFWLLTTIWVGA